MRKQLLTDRDDLFVVHDFLTEAECQYYITLSESAGYGDAPINTLGGPRIRKDIRNNDRVMIDDARLARDLWERLEMKAPDAGSLFHFQDDRPPARADGRNEREANG